mgnify:CR=1 FL=1
MLSRHSITASKQAKRLFSDVFTTGTNSFYIEKMYDAWKKDPESVHTSWQAYFKGLEAGVDSFTTPPDLGTVAIGETFSPARDTQKALLLLRAYQLYGYILADLDPLNLTLNVEQHSVARRIPGLIRMENYNFTEEDMEKEFDLGSDLVTGFIHSNSPSKGKWKLRDLLEACKRTYCGKIGYEYMHIPFRDECNWMRERIEKDTPFKYSADQKREILSRVAEATMLEEFLHKKFSTHKRFGLDGLESLVLAVESIIEQAVDRGVNYVAIGMPHRGRLNLMANVLQHKIEQMFGLFFGISEQYMEEGDVKYHLGQTVEREIKGKKVTIDLLPNPSHLEAVDPVAVGKTRANQNSQLSRNKAMCILIHGDAALAGQGVVYETMQMEDLFDYSTGGCVHLVINNNIGFTTTPREARSGLFPTEIAKAIGAPIFHVNADHPEEVDFVSRIAADWRSEFRKSVFIDLIGYRRFGHNELDEPLFTNPKMYQLIHKHPNTLKLYSERLVQEGVYTQAEINNIGKGINSEYETHFRNAKQMAENKSGLKTRPARSMLLKDTEPTGVSTEILRNLGRKVFTLPKDLNPHPQITKLYKNKVAAVERGSGIDWATAESLAWASILTQEKMHVRISGQDVQRGTFSQRHSVIHDQQVDRKKYIPLNHLSEDQPLFSAINSHLSEYGALGFDYGYSLANPDALVMWEAQFGDFCNGAQITIDQYITAGEAKWGEQSGLVMLLPHGYDGQGAEHSCARLGRFLQLSKEHPYKIPYEFIQENSQVYHNNIQVMNISTPANYFHALRRQIKRDFRKPLIVMSPKRLLRHKECISDLEDMGSGEVTLVYDEKSPKIVSPDSVRKVIFCSGQVYYDLVEERRKREINDIAICRLEQIAPFPFGKVEEITKKYRKAEYQWVQEEPLNLGAWQNVLPRFNTVFKKEGKDPLAVVSRPPSAAAATGYLSVHTQELLDLLDKAMS